MEKGIEGFHFIPLTIWFGDFKQKLTTDDRHFLFMGSCDLLEILALIADPAPGLVIERLKQAIQRFKDHVTSLLQRNASKGIKRAITPKMHEVFSHMLDHMCQAGPSDTFSARLHETFHRLITDLYAAGSRRQSDSLALHEIMSAMFFRHVTKEAQLLDV